VGPSYGLWAPPMSCVGINTNSKAHTGRPSMFQSVNPKKRNQSPAPLKPFLSAFLTSPINGNTVPVMLLGWYLSKKILINYFKVIAIYGIPYLF